MTPAVHLVLPGLGGGRLHAWRRLTTSVGDRVYPPGMVTVTIDDLPHALYRIYDGQDRKTLLYIGISVSWPRRMSQHQASKDWFPLDGVVVFEEYPDRASALAAEAAAIRAEHPLHNVQHNSTVRIEASISAELHVSASGIFAMAAAGSGLLLAGQWLADVLAAWWTQRRAAQQGVTLQIPPAQNPFTQDPPGPLLKFFWFSLAAMNAFAEAETKTKTVGPNQAAMAFYMAMVKAQDTDALAADSADIRRQIDAGSQNVRDQIAANRGNRIWEKQAAAYTDAIAGVRHRQKVHGCQIVGTRIGTEPERPKVPVDWVDVEARLIAYSTPAVLAALQEAVRGGQRFEDLLAIWKDDTEQARAAQELVSEGVMPPAWPKHRASREELDTVRKEADALDDALIAEIRAELHGANPADHFPPVPPD